jgi:hypothetical protein
VKGTVQFDPKAGAVRGSEYVTEMSGELKLNDSDNPLKVEFKHKVEWEVR